jgi:hypothetical protein
MTAMPMQIESELFLCDYERANGRWQLWAVLDELTLTYSVITRAPNGPSFELRRHVPSMREARVWASRYRDSQSAAGGVRDHAGASAAASLPAIKARSSR